MPKRTTVPTLPRSRSLSAAVGEPDRRRTVDGRNLVVDLHAGFVGRAAGEDVGDAHVRRRSFERELDADAAEFRAVEKADELVVRGGIEQQRVRIVHRRELTAHRRIDEPAPLDAIAVVQDAQRDEPHDLVLGAPTVDVARRIRQLRVGDAARVQIGHDSQRAPPSKRAGVTGS